MCKYTLKKCQIMYQYSTIRSYLSFLIFPRLVHIFLQEHEHNSETMFNQLLHNVAHPGQAVQHVQVNSHERAKQGINNNVV